MSKYFPLLRGKQNELLALRHLALRISGSQRICPILELVNDNTTTKNSLDHFVDAEMPFVLVTNPDCGDFKGRVGDFCRSFIEDGPLTEYDNFIAGIHVYPNTTMDDIDRYLGRYGHLFRAVIYGGEPTSSEVHNWCRTDDRIYHHIFMEGLVPTSFVNETPKVRRVILDDKFRKQIRNADYPERELFTDWNTPEGNPDGLDWGDLSIVGDNFSESGGPAYAVAIHHIHQPDEGGSLYINHYLSDRQDTPADPSGKTLEALAKLISDLPGLRPNDTDACDTYREMDATSNAKSLGYLKRLAIMHHLEVILKS